MSLAKESNPMNYTHFAPTRLTREPTFAERIGEQMREEVRALRRAARAKRNAERAALLALRPYRPVKITDADIVRLLGGD